MKYGIVLKEKPGISGLTRRDVAYVFDMLNCEEAYPIELEAKEHESVAMGFIDPKFASMLEYDYEKSGLHDFIAAILDDMEKEDDTNVYEHHYNGNRIPIYLYR